MILRRVCQLPNQGAKYVKPLCIILSVKEPPGTGPRSSGREICTFVMKPAVANPISWKCLLKLGILAADTRRSICIQDICFYHQGIVQLEERLQKFLDDDRYYFEN